MGTYGVLNTFSRSSKLLCGILGSKNSLSDEKIHNKAVDITESEVSSVFLYDFTSGLSMNSHFSAR